MDARGFVQVLSNADKDKEKKKVNV